MPLALAVIVLIAAVILGSLAVLYNGLVRSRTLTDQAWKRLNIELKNRSDLIPNLLNLIKSSSSEHDLSELAAARTAAMKTTGIGQKADREGYLSQIMGQLLQPSSDGLSELEKQAIEAEAKIQLGIQSYNVNVAAYNDKLKTFPTNLISGVLGFTQREYFESGQQAVINRSKQSIIRSSQ